MRAIAKSGLRIRRKQRFRYVDEAVENSQRDHCDVPAQCGGGLSHFAGVLKEKKVLLLARATHADERREVAFPTVQYHGQNLGNRQNDQNFYRSNRKLSLDLVADLRLI
ncbi:hypothetical protein FOPE_04883 [Fonsecaea pedrosoi]|nr:hypothetical protein FOPE_04883 [Fonsecaea pedrosoi]